MKLREAGGERQKGRDKKRKSEGRERESRTAYRRLCASMLHTVLTTTIKHTFLF